MPRNDKSRRGGRMRPPMGRANCPQSPFSHTGTPATCARTSGMILEGKVLEGIALEGDALHLSALAHKAPVVHGAVELQGLVEGR